MTYLNKCIQSCLIFSLCFSLCFPASVFAQDGPSRQQAPGGGQGADEQPSTSGAGNGIAPVTTTQLTAIKKKLEDFSRYLDDWGSTDPDVQKNLVQIRDVFAKLFSCPMDLLKQRLEKQQKHLEEVLATATATATAVSSASMPTRSAIPAETGRSVPIADRSTTDSYKQEAQAKMTVLQRQRAIQSFSRIISKLPARYFNHAVTHLAYCYIILPNRFEKSDEIAYQRQQIEMAFQAIYGASKHLLPQVDEGFALRTTKTMNEWTLDKAMAYLLLGLLTFQILKSGYKRITGEGSYLRGLGGRIRGRASDLRERLGRRRGGRPAEGAPRPGTAPSGTAKTMAERLGLPEPNDTIDDIARNPEIVASSLDPKQQALAKDLEEVTKTAFEESKQAALDKLNKLRLQGGATIDSDTRKKLLGHFTKKDIITRDFEIRIARNPTVSSAREFPREGMHLIGEVEAELNSLRVVQNSGQELQSIRTARSNQTENFIATTDRVGMPGTGSPLPAERLQPPIFTTKGMGREVTRYRIDQNSGDLVGVEPIDDILARHLGTGTSSGSAQLVFPDGASTAGAAAAATAGQATGTASAGRIFTARRLIIVGGAGIVGGALYYNYGYADKIEKIMDETYANANLMLREIKKGVLNSYDETTKILSTLSKEIKDLVLLQASLLTEEEFKEKLVIEILGNPSLQALVEANMVSNLPLGITEQDLNVVEDQLSGTLKAKLKDKSTADVINEVNKFISDNLTRIEDELKSINTEDLKVSPAPSATEKAMEEHPGLSPVAGAADFAPPKEITETIASARSALKLIDVEKLTFKGGK